MRNIKLKKIQEAENEILYGAEYKESMTHEEICQQFRLESLYLERCVVGDKRSKAAIQKMGETFNLKMERKYKSVADLNNNSISWYRKKKALLKDFRELRIRQDEYYDMYDNRLNNRETA